MGLKPDAALWFEILVPREQLTATLECLATTEAVELQTHSQTEAVIIVPDLDEALAAHADRQRRFGPWWPDAEIPPVEEASEPALLLEQAERRISAWEADAVEPVRELQGIDSGQHPVGRTERGSPPPRPRQPRPPHPGKGHHVLGPQ